MRDSLRKIARITIRTLSIIFLPNQCLYCQKIVENGSHFCVPCMDLLEIIKEPYCKKCSLPYHFSRARIGCQKCRENNFCFEKNVSSFLYNDLIKYLMNQIKNRHNISSIPFLAQCMFLSYKSRLNGITFDIITCIPSGSETIFKRGFNAASLLAADFNKFFQKDLKQAALESGERKQNVRYLPNLLFKVNKGKNQKTLSLKERQLAKHGFTINEKYRPIIEGSTILLIDDIATTCGTLNAASLRLVKAGAYKIYCLTTARVDFI